MLKVNSDNAIYQRTIMRLEDCFMNNKLRWSVIQKEAYGIYYSCMYSESLLRDHPFTIRTDHRNLLFIKQSSF